MNANFDHARELVRTRDRDRYLAGLFAEAEHRDGLWALFAFSSEIARVRDLVRDPLPGEIRLQWWRDFLEGQGHGETAANPVAAVLSQTIERYSLPVSALQAMIDARVFDLYDDPMPSLNDLEGYSGETSSLVMQLAMQILAGGEVPGSADAAGHAGVAHAMTGILLNLPRHASRGQMFLPADLLDRHGVECEAVFGGERTPEIDAAIAEYRGHIRHHLAKAEKTFESLDHRLKPAVLPVALVAPLLRQYETGKADPLHSPAVLSPLRRQWILWRSARSGKIS